MGTFPSCSHSSSINKVLLQLYRAVIATALCKEAIPPFMQWPSKKGKWIGKVRPDVIASNHRKVLTSEVFHHPRLSSKFSYFSWLDVRFWLFVIFAVITGKSVWSFVRPQDLTSFCFCSAKFLTLSLTQMPVRPGLISMTFARGYSVEDELQRLWEFDDHPV